MANSVTAQISGLIPWRLGRLTQLLLLAATVLVYSVLSIAIANSLFVNHVGARHLPFAFILIGLCSILAYTGFSQVVDRFSRPKLFQVSLAISSLLAIGLWFILKLDTPVVYYALLIAGFFQWDFYNNILYPSLLTDYFTTLEYKQYAPFIGIAQAIGTMIGGGLAALLSYLLSTANLLLCMPVIFAIAIFQLWYLDSTQRRLDSPKPNDHAGILETLKTLPDLVRRYPLILLLATSSFLLVILYTSSEFLWFSIYSQTFKGDALTGLLGIMRIVISLVQVGVLYLFTRPLLHWVGVARMNPVYPLTTLVSFIGLALNLNLPAALALQMNGDALYKSINLPVHQLNYNAIPREFIGRVRTLSDGIIYALGLTLSGIFLSICERTLSLTQITLAAGSLTLVLLAVRIPMGRFYAQGLEDMIRSDTINLDDFSESQTQLPPQSSEAIRELLTNDDRYTRLKGLELASYTGDPIQFMPEVLALLPADAQTQTRIVQLFCQSEPADLQPFVALLEGESALQTAALEVLIANQYPFELEQLTALAQVSELNSHNTRLLATLATTDLSQQTLLDEALASLALTTHDLTPESISTLVRIMAVSQKRAWLPLIERVLPQANTEIKRKCLEALIPLGTLGDTQLAALGHVELNHDDPAIREGALKLLQTTRCESTLGAIAERLGDLDPRVRQQAARTVATFGRKGLVLAKTYLASTDLEVVNTAIAAIGQVRIREAGNLLFNYLSPQLQQIAITRQWQQQIPIDDPDWQLLGVAIANYHQRIIDRVLYILSCLGHSRTVNTVVQVLATTDQKDLANAIEVLASLNHRRFVLPLIPLLEQRVQQSPLPAQPNLGSTDFIPWLRTRGYKILLEAMESQDRWIRTGALIALSRVPSALIDDPDPIVQTIARQLLPAPRQHKIEPPPPMNRLLLLKDVALFKNLSLDELFLIEQALEQVQVLAGETIFSEGSWGAHLYIVATGKVQLVKQIDNEERELKQLTAGQYFGEIALFDDAPRWNGAIALEEGILFKLEKNRFISLITQRPHIILELCRFLSTQLRETDTFRAPRSLLSSAPEALG